VTVALSAPIRRRARVRVTGTVQGVGFRPYVYRLARELGLGGFVLNDAHGVLLEIEGRDAAVEEFLDRLAPEAPPLAALERVAAEELGPAGFNAFEIRASPRGERADAPVTPDTATCEQCLRELFDPRDRRYRYPFINCTNCGPRFTIVCGIPYDRPYTTMAGFDMCARCREEYESPTDRRFHAQPNACPQCGPSVALLDAAGTAAAVAGARDDVQAAAIALRDGAIVAVKGIGGFHVACRADHEPAVAALRSRKHREDKPFALMAGSLAAAGALVALGEPERELLQAPQRPIVLASRVDGAPVADAVAPGARELGVMLPYSPLHHLLLADAGTTLVMTSGNISDEPIAYEDGDALQRLAGLADLFLVHDRPIETRTDDSVVRSVPVAGRRRTVFLRRSRGYVPGSLPLPGGTEQPLLACGAELKSTFCLVKGERAWVSHHIGDLENYETLRSFTDGIEHFKRLFAVEPAVAAHDLHPEYLSTKYALESDGVELIGVQHHHAHLAACLAEHGINGPALGVIFDGTGYGTDGTAWGGELLYGDLSEVRRVGMLQPVRLPGGERAIRQPWRMACAWLDAAFGACDPEPPAGLVAQVPAEAWRNVCGLVRSGVASPLTTSMGRLFDAVAALCGIRATVNYEGQAAIELERACDPSERGAYPLELRTGDGLLVLDAGETIRAVVSDVTAGSPVGTIASRFHAAIALATLEACVRAAAQQSTELVVLSGGVFQNRSLLSRLADDLSAAGLRVLVPEKLPVNDGGISYGQAAVAARRLAAGVAGRRGADRAGRLGGGGAGPSTGTGRG
jgi:hydrogenase maturation protein HypF